MFEDLRNGSSSGVAPTQPRGDAVGMDWVRGATSGRRLFHYGDGRSERGERASGPRPFIDPAPPAGLGSEYSEPAVGMPEPEVCLSATPEDGARRQPEGPAAAAPGADADTEKRAVKDADAADDWPPYRYPRGTVPEEAAPLVSRLVFFWARSLFRRAAYLSRQGAALEHEDLLPLPRQDLAARVGGVFEASWARDTDRAQLRRKEADADDAGEAAAVASEPAAAATTPGTKKNDTARMRRALAAVVGWPFIVAGAIKFVNTCLQFSYPLLLQAILKFIQDVQSGAIPPDAPPGQRYRGYWLSCILFAAMFSKAMTENAYFNRTYRAGYQCRVAVSVAVYNKALRLANAERQSTTLGELVNLMQVDSTKIEMFVPQVHVLWDGLFQIIGYMVILYTLIGWPCFAGLVVMVAAGPLQGVIMKRLFGLNYRYARHTDTRVKTTNEAIQGIQSVKMFCWEDSFEREITKSRDTELSLLRRVAYLRGFSRAYMSALPGIVAVVSFVVYTFAYTGATNSASTLFAALAAFDQLRFPLLFYPVAFAALAQAGTSAARVENFLNMKEVGKGEYTGGGHYLREDAGAPSDAPSAVDAAGRGGEIIVKNATIYWSNPDVPIADFADDETTSVASSNDKAERESDSGNHTPTDVEEGSAKRYPKAVLNNVSLHVQPGELCAVVGRVASGKSTLCSAVLNETILSEGDIILRGSVAYVAQTPWILNATLRDNILFGKPYDEEKYQRVLKACQLLYDIEILTDGDMTEIGERGINLSGGQKQRVSVARAAYSDADTIILDDPLSALDPEVGKRLFEECIVGLMKGKTRLFVTNQIQFLQSCDRIIALGHRKVLEQGTYTDLTQKEDSELKRILDEDRASKQHDATSSNKAAETNPDAEIVKANVEVLPKQKEEKEKTGLISKEERNIGAVQWQVYKKYIQAGGGFFKFTFVFACFLLCVLIQLASTAWVSFWTSDIGYVRFGPGFYLGLYGAIAVFLGVFTYARTFMLARFGVKASGVLHKNLLFSILAAPQSFFDTTPVGRILSRFSKDFYSIDIEVAENLDFFLSMVLSVIFSVGSILYVTPWFGVAIVPLGYFYVTILNYFRNVSRETKRLESLSRSPVYAHFSETLGGLTTIRAYGQSKRFQGEFDKKSDENIRAFYCIKTADRWLSVRLEFIGATIAGLSAVFASNVAISNSVSGHETNQAFASLAGLSISFAISITGMLNWCVRTFAQLEAGMNAVERVLYYSEEIPQEAPRTAVELAARAASSKDPPSTDPSVFAVVASGGKVAPMPTDWPETGSINLQNLRMKYRGDTPLVLKGLDVSITAGERIGVVGRTGSGKSSLLLTLLRLVEPYLEEKDRADYKAPISIDGVDVLRIGLKELRTKLGIIPQNPVLFSGTVRSNVDPFDQYNDNEIWFALDKCGMKAAVEEMPGMLSAPIAEYGENLSAGSRQMLVLGRALLKQCRVLLLDEATSSVDYETDRQIQRTIREAFPGRTVLTIAHRINTILDSDKILVMQDGLVAEFAPPQELLADPNSIFSAIVRHAEADTVE